MEVDSRMHAASFHPTYPPNTFDPLALSSRDFFPPHHTAPSYMPSAAHVPQSSVAYAYPAYSVEGRFASTASYANAQPSSMHLPPAGGSSQHYRYSQPAPPPTQHLQSPSSLQPVTAQVWQSQGQTQTQTQSRPSSVAALAHPSGSLHIASAASAAASIMPPSGRRETRRSPQGEAERAPQAAILYEQSRILPHGALSAQRGGAAYGANSTRLPPILQVEKQTVTTSATQAASASRRRNEANFQCPVPGCGSTFTRRFNLRGHLRSHTEERPFVCEWPGCGKGFARQHDCKRHQALHAARSQTSNVCQGCGKTFSRLDALNRHLRSEGGVECRQTADAVAIAARGSPNEEDWEDQSSSSDRKASP